MTYTLGVKEKSNRAFRFLALIAIISAIFGCEKINPSEKKRGIVVASISQDTKLGITPNQDGDLGYKLAWEVGDIILVSSEDGSTYIGSFQIKSETDIKTDGSAEFLPYSENTPELDPLKKYRFFHQSTLKSEANYSYKTSTSLSSFKNNKANVTSEQDLVYVKLHTPTPTSIEKPISLVHLFAYFEVVINVPNNLTVRVKYTDSYTKINYLHEYRIDKKDWEGTIDGSEYRFSFPTPPANISNSKPIIIEASSDNFFWETLYTSENNVVVEAGKHYRINATTDSGGGLSGSFNEASPTVDVSYQGLREVSGANESLKNKDHFWALSDSGSGNYIYLVNQKGEIIVRASIDGVLNKDWEAMAIDTKRGHIYIGEIGHSTYASSTKTIYRINEPTVDITQRNVDISISGAISMKYTYSEGVRDAETLMYDPISDELVVITKSYPTSYVYQFPFEENTNPISIIGNGMQFSSFPLSSDYLGPTAGDISQNGEYIIVKTYIDLLYWRRNTNDKNIWRCLKSGVQSIKYRLEPQGEAVWWDAEGINFYTLSEYGTVHSNPFIAAYFPKPTTPVLYLYERKQ